MRLYEIAGRVVKGVNTTPDVGVDAIKKQAAKFGNTVDKDGRPPIINKKTRGSSANTAFNLGLAESKNITEGYKLQLERDTDMMVLHIVDTATGKRTEVRGKPGYETNYDPNDSLHILLDKVGRSANISELMNGEVVTINPKHPDADRAKAATNMAFNEVQCKWNPNLAKTHSALEIAIIEGGHSLEENLAGGKKTIQEAFNESKEMKISDLTISDAGLAIAQSAGGGSKTDAPLTVTKLPSGYVYLLNGYHRLVDAMKAGKDTVSVEFVPYEKVEILWKNEREEDIKYGKQFNVNENFADGKVKGKSRPGRVKRAGASCKGSVTDLRKKAKNSSGEKAKMYHWCANMKSGRQKK